MIAAALNKRKEGRYESFANASTGREWLYYISTGFSLFLVPLLQQYVRSDML